MVGWNDTTATVQSVTDSRGTVTLAIGPTSGTALRQAIYYAKGIGGGATTVTVTFTRPAVYPAPDGDLAEDRLLTAIGTYGATAPLRTSGAWVMQLVTFR